MRAAICRSTDISPTRKFGTRKQLRSEDVSWRRRLLRHGRVLLDELAAERVKLLEQESAELEREAEKLAEEIKELSGTESSVG